MDIASLIGIFAGVGVIVHALATGAAPPESFYSLPSIEIVLGGTIAATLLSFPIKEVLRITKITVIIFKKGTTDTLGPYVNEIVELSRSARMGVSELEKSKDALSNYFLKDGVQMIINGYTEPEIRDIMESRIENREIREKWEENVLRTMGKFAPGFGMMGTLIGLIGMLVSMGGEADPSKTIGPNMAVALITTFYGVLLANLFFNPMAEKFKSRIEQQTVLQNMVIEGVVLLYQKKHPLVVREKLNSFIPPSEWEQDAEGGGEKS
ncbi:MAG: MotA/TolQ/ExbB proton channel family protein [Candidatus Marinimicrobia bacterium]|nr:MotA/TolQ/ExbB proton channel family protein [Candidatus Neomarinimicrobiota bacterium]